MLKAIILVNNPLVNNTERNLDILLILQHKHIFINHYYYKQSRQFLNKFICAQN